MQKNEKYIFISYAHKDTDLVLPMINTMKEAGFRLWYDAGIEAGTEWAEYIEERILGADSFILFLSKASVESQNCREEFGLARDESKNILVVYLEDLQPSDLRHGLRLRIPSYQCLFRTKHESNDSFIKELCGARILQACRGEAAKKASPAPAKASKATPRKSQRPEKPSKGLAYDNAGAASVSVSGIGDCKDSVISVPPQAEGKTVTAIGRTAFEGNGNITAVFLPEGLTTIERGAFFGCTALEEIELPSTLTYIAGSAFYGCTSLRACALPPKVTCIEIYTFFGCTALRSVTLPRGLEVIELGAFMDCPRLSTLEYEGTVAEWEKLSAASPDWRESTAIRLVRCTDGTVTLAPLAEGEADPNEAEDENRDSESKQFYAEANDRDTDSLQFTAIPGKHGYSVAAEDKSLRTAVLPSSYNAAPVLALEDNAFAGCAALTEICLPSTLKEIGSSAFSGCTSLTAIRLPEGVEVLNMCTFLSCAALTEVTLPKSLKSIDVCVFSGCESLTAIRYAGTKAEWATVAEASWKWNDGAPITTVHCADGDVAL